MASEEQNQGNRFRLSIGGIYHKIITLPKGSGTATLRKHLTREPWIVTDDGTYVRSASVTSFEVLSWRPSEVPR